MKRRVRGSFGQWTTAEQTGAVRDHRGGDAALLALVDGGGPLHRADDACPGCPDPDHPDRRATPRRTVRPRRKGVNR